MIPFNYRLELGDRFYKTDDFATDGHVLWRVPWLIDQKIKRPWAKRICEMRNGTYVYGEHVSDTAVRIDHVLPVIHTYREFNVADICDWHGDLSQIKSFALKGSKVSTDKTGLTVETAFKIWFDPKFAEFFRIPGVTWKVKDEISSVIALQGATVVMVVMPMRGPK